MLGKQLKEAQTSLKLMEPPEKDWVSLTMVSTFRFVFLLDSCLVRDASIVSLASGSRRQGRAQGGREVGRSTARSSAGRLAPHLYHLVRDRRPATSEGSFLLAQPRSGRVAGV